jgi:hypothetical protein
MKNRKGSSETIRETLLDKNTIFKPYIDLISKTTLFDLFSRFKRNTSNKPDEVFHVVYWFFEAEGSFSMEGQWKTKVSLPSIRKIL